MSSQFSPNQDAVAPGALLESTRWADSYTLAAAKALGIIYRGETILQRNCVFPANILAGPALTANLARDFRPAGANEPHVNDLRAGAGIGTVGDGDAKLMVHLKRALDPLF